MTNKSIENKKGWESTCAGRALKTGKVRADKCAPRGGVIEDQL